MVGRQGLFIKGVLLSLFAMIRVERQEDNRAVENLARETFWNLFIQGAYQHFLIRNLRKSKDFIPGLSLVMEEDKQIVAHIIYSHSKVTYEGGRVLPAITFGPLSVLLSKQQKGLGSKLIKYSLQRAKQMGFKAVIMIGHPSFYQRFGFRCIKQANICLKGGFVHSGTQFLEFQQGYLTSNTTLGVFEYSSQWNFKKEDLQQFDLQFPPKEKYQTRSQKEFQKFKMVRWDQELPTIKDFYNRQRLE